MQIHELQNTATAADLTGDNYFVMDGIGGSKKVPADFAKLQKINPATDTQAEIWDKISSYSGDVVVGIPSVGTAVEVEMYQLAYTKIENNVYTARFETTSGGLIKAATCVLNDVTASTLGTWTYETQSTVDGLPAIMADLQKSSDPHAGTLLQKVGNEIKELDGNSVAKASGVDYLEKILFEKVVEENEEIDFEILPTNVREPYDGGWRNRSISNHSVIKVSQFKYVAITANSNLGARYTFLKSYDAENVASSSPNPPDYCDGYDGLVVINKSLTSVINVPNDAHYILVMRVLSSNDVTPALMALESDGEIERRLASAEKSLNILNSKKTQVQVIKKFERGDGGTSGICVGKRSENGVDIPQIWYFLYNADDGSETKRMYRCDVDIDSGTCVRHDYIMNNLGHCNSVDYCFETDTMIMGNGSNDYNLPNHLFIVENASGRSSMMRKEVIDVDCSSFNLGQKLNVVWGEDNDGAFDICHFLLNDSHKIIKVQLGKGSNIFDYGTAIQADENRFNGTFRIVDVKEWGAYDHNIHDYDNVVQGATYLDGKIYWGFGHSNGQLAIRCAAMTEDGLEIKTLLSKSFSSSGVEVKNTIYGLGKIDGKIIAYTNDWQMRVIEKF